MHRRASGQRAPRNNRLKCQERKKGKNISASIIFISSIVPVTVFDATNHLMRAVNTLRQIKLKIYMIYNEDNPSRAVLSSPVQNNFQQCSVPNSQNRHRNLIFVFGALNEPHYRTLRIPSEARSYHSKINYRRTLESLRTKL